MHNLHGGAIKKNPEKTGFDPMLDMLENSTANLALFSDTSDYSFICILTIHPDHSEYTTMDGTPITSFILKFVVTASEKNERLPEYRDEINKLSESESTFVNEARTQQQIWAQSVEYGKPEICPDMIDLFTFDYRNSRNLIRYLNTLHVCDDSMQKMLIYLKNHIFNKVSGSYGIGLIVMPKVDYLTLESSTPTKMIYYNLIAQIVRLFIEIGIIHLDLHSNNILVNQSNSYCEIIDFGQILRLQSVDYDRYRSRYEELNNDAEKSEFMKDTFNHIIDREISQLKILYPRKENISAIKSLGQYASRNPDIYLLAFEKLVEFMPPPQSSIQKKSKRKPGSIVKSNKRGKNNTLENGNIPEIYTFDPTISIPEMSEKAYIDKRTTLEFEKKQKEIEKQRKWDETHPTDITSVNPWDCKTDEKSSEWCSISGGKRKTIKSKTKKRKRIKKKKKTYKKHTRKQK